MTHEPLHMDGMDGEFPFDHKDGHITVVDNQILIKDAERLGKQPVLVESDTVEVWINGIPLKGTKVVFSSDQITWRPRETGELFQLKVTPDQLEVHFQLVDKPKSSNLKPVQAAVSCKLEMDDINSAAIQSFMAQIKEALHKLGVLSPDIVSITQELLTPTFQPIVIARGVPPQTGEDGWLETYFEHSTTHMLQETEGRVDFRQRREIPSVESGTVIAEIHPPQPGKNGISVFGTPLEAASGREVVVKAGKNVEVVRGKCVALRSGRPVVTGTTSRYIDIQQVYEHRGNVNLETGHIFFNGDVVIRGDVEEDMHVEAFGNITVYGNVYKSTLISAQNIYVTGTIFGSHLAGGKVGLLYSKVYNILDHFLKQFALLVESVDTLQERFIQKGDERATYGYLAELLIKMKYPIISKLAGQYAEVMKLAGKMVPPEVLMVDRMLGTFRKAELLRQKNTKQELLAIAEYMVRLQDRIKEGVFAESDMVISSANGTKLETTGDIIVIGTGTVQSELYAGGQIAYKLPDSSCRGGRLVAGTKIEVREVVSGQRVYLEAREQISVYSGRELRLVMSGAAMDVYDECREAVFVKRNGRIAMLPMSSRKR